MGHDEVYEVLVAAAAEPIKPFQDAHIDPARLYGISGACMITFDSKIKLLDFAFHTSNENWDSLQAKVMKEFGSAFTIKREESPVKYTRYKWVVEGNEYDLMDSKYGAEFWGKSPKVKSDTTVPMFPPEIIPSSGLGSSN